MNPGPAISTRDTSSLAGSAATSACARSRGLRFAALASCSATLVAKSPWVESRVRSTTMPVADPVGRSSSGRAPRASCTSFSIRYFKVLPSTSGGCRESREFREPTRGQNRALRGIRTAPADRHRVPSAPCVRQALLPAAAPSVPAAAAMANASLHAASAARGNGRRGAPSAQPPGRAPRRLQRRTPRRSSFACSRNASGASRPGASARNTATRANGGQCACSRSTSAAAANAS